LITWTVIVLGSFMAVAIVVVAEVFSFDSTIFQ
jgi:hypothetical protein